MGKLIAALVWWLLCGALSGCATAIATVLSYRFGIYLLSLLGFH